MDYETAKSIIGTVCLKREEAPKGKSFLSPDLELHGTGDIETADYFKDPLFPVWRLENVRPSNRDFGREQKPECTYGDLGSTVNFWKVSERTDCVTIRFKMPTAAASTSMPNRDGVIVGGRQSARGYSDGTDRGYPIELGLSTAQVSLAVRRDDTWLSTFRPASSSQDHPRRTEGVLEHEAEEEARDLCAQYYL